VLNQLKHLTRDSIIYGIGHIATRLLTFLLLPYYSFHLSPAEYGELTLYFLFVGVAQAFFFYGLDIAYLRYFTLNKDSEQRRVVTGTALMTTVVTSGLLALAIVAAAGAIGRLVVHAPTHPQAVVTLVRLCAGILFFDTLSTFPFLLLRGTLRPTHFIAVKVLNVAVNIGLNIWFVGGLGLSISGVMWANLAASALTFLALVPVVWSGTVWSFDRGLVREMIRFGLPNVPTYLFVMIIELADRKVLELYRGLEEAGLYSAGYKLGMFMAVVTGAFRFAWQPFFLSHGDEENAPALFARVLTYYLLVTSSLFILLSFFIDPLIRTHWPGIGYVLEPRYWPGLVVFPIILLAHIFDGVYANFMVGVYLRKLTGWLPLVTGVAALFTIVLCVLFVPSFGMIAAAWVTLLSFALEAALLYLVVRRHYHVPYEWTRVAKLAVACAAVAGLGLTPLCSAVWARVLLVPAFPGLLFLLRFFDEREIFHLRRWLLRR
jgi:O-antigen/teichoic acid export membrane protein